MTQFSDLREAGGATLHALRVAGWLDPERLAAWDVGNPQEVLDQAVEAGLVRQAQTPRGAMWGLTPGGTGRAEELLAQWLAGDDGPGTAALTAVLTGFEAHDGELKSLVTRYQRGARDDIGERLREFSERAEPAVREVARTAPLWATYPARLENALLRVEKGDLTYVTSPLVESYHTVWHLAHRDMRLVREQA
ncbi:hypothetical protein [Streptomyces sp. TP-A0874]|uniref:hypothetical protein n=1 Tax=Streptomyces sp. TP-A0874 TaxID=549819 RepID=UPI000852FBAC|nr:hypothetical protein [Streptomyces sp. TP-A0874]